MHGITMMQKRLFVSILTEDGEWTDAMGQSAI
jgi:hypothetical protein